MTDEQRVKKAIHDKILREWADKGKVIEGGWRGLCAIWNLTGAPEVQKMEMRRAFYAGAQHTFGSIMGLMGPNQEEPSDREMKVLDDIHKELDAFAAEMAALKDQ